MDIGIDLGTTFSVIAVKGQVDFAENYPPGEYLEESDITIIPTPLGEMTMPSVFWVDPEHPEYVLIGSEAKDKADEGETPVMFSKRSIGTDEYLTIGDKNFSARDIATEILKYLKYCAEQALGCKVTRAVITHPAYFDRNQIEETKQAAIAAGLDLSLDEQLMMEPAAAALSYIHSNEQDPLTVMTYDLGGGTFDVTILQRCEGVVSLLSFDGDHLLGGYNFDRELMQWVLEQTALRMKETGRSLKDYEQDEVAGGIVRAKLLRLAERVKEQLSLARTDKIIVTIKLNDALEDNEGRSVPILLRINREQYVELIKVHLQKTIFCCHRALDKAGIGIDKLDAILMVGGSTHGPWVHDSVSEAFCDPLGYEPDLCVGAGAAIQASLLPPIAAGGGLELILDVPASSVLPEVNVTGLIRNADQSSLTSNNAKQLSAILALQNGEHIASVEIGDNATFLFEDVLLQEQGVTEFVLQITDQQGLQRISKAFTVTYDTDADEGTVFSTSLPKPLYLQAASGMRLIAEEGEQLPAKCEVELTRIQNDASLQIAIYQGQKGVETEIGSVIVANIPEQAGIGSKVMVDVEITTCNRLCGTARVFPKGSDVAVTEAPVNVEFPPLVIADLDHLRAEFYELENTRAEALVLSQDPEHRTLLAGQGKKLAKKITKLFAEIAPDRQEIHRALKELGRLIRPPADDMQPPRAEFAKKVKEARTILEQKPDDLEMDAYRNSLQKIEIGGNDAHATKNRKNWATINESLTELLRRLEPDTSAPSSSSLPTPPTSILKAQVQHMLDELHTKVMKRHEILASDDRYAHIYKLRLDAIEKQIKPMQSAIDKIDDSLDSETALNQIRVIMRPYKELEQKVEHVTDDVD